MGGAWRIGDIWGLSVLLDQLFCKPETALKVLKNKANYTHTHKSVYKNNPIFHQTIWRDIFIYTFVPTGLFFPQCIYMSALNVSKILLFITLELKRKYYQPHKENTLTRNSLMELKNCANK